MRFLYAFIVVLCVISFVVPAWAADEAPANPKKANVVTTDLFWMALGVTNAEYEHTIDKGSSYAVRLKMGDQDFGDWSWSILGAGGSYRGYFSNGAPSGGYWGAGMDMLNIDAEVTTLGIKEKGSSSFIVPKFEIGYQYVADMGFTFAGGADIDFYSGSLKVGNDEFPLNGMGFGIRLAFGYGW